MYVNKRLNGILHSKLGSPEKNNIIAKGIQMEIHKNILTVNICRQLTSKEFSIAPNSRNVQCFYKIFLTRIKVLEFTALKTLNQITAYNKNV